MQARELRQKYLEFFESKGALRHPSDSLKTSDPTLLFTVAGMVPFKAYFEDRATPPRRSMATSQKCLRTKDIEDIGDISHCTFFEMLGNFSFGDYFKKEAIAWSYEFLFDVLKLEKSRIRVTVYEEDEDAYNYWCEAGLPATHISKFGQKSNYWPPNAIIEQSQGPCGPCSEIFFDLQPDKPFDPDWDGEGMRWLEIWNNVFTQFTGEGTGDDYELIPLKNKNIDTGMGLERTAAAINNLSGPFETDVLRPIIAHLENLSGKTYHSTPDSPTDIAFRRIADHIRATVFLIGDGITPSPNAHGYVLRRLMRRAIVAGSRHLGFAKEPFLDRAVPGVIENMKDAYPELVERQESILRTVREEETAFRNTLENGIARLENALQVGKLSGKEAFDLYQTYGLPLEVTEELAGEQGISIDREEYDKAKSQHEADSGKGKKDTWVTMDESTKELLRNLPPTKFVGYDTLETTSTIMGIIVDGKSVQTIEAEQEGEIILDVSPFYAESGGQIGDIGAISTDLSRFQLSHNGTQKREGIWFHKGRVEYGKLIVGDIVDTQVWDRNTVTRSHTATHLLHAALRNNLGTHVAQKGSSVTGDRLRFDFSHNSAISEELLRTIESEINIEVVIGNDILINELPIERAKNMGAMMLFGEKYGDIVRVVSIGGSKSVEFCGGTHVKNTSDITLFKILSETSAAAGIRRIEAITGPLAIEYINKKADKLNQIGAILGTKADNAPEAVERLQVRLKELESELKTLKSAQAGSLADDLLAQATQKDGMKIVIASVETDDLGALADELIGKISAGVVFLGTTKDDKVQFVAKATKDAVSTGVHCGNLVKAAAQIAGGGGGGRPDFAQAGGRDATKLDEALEAVRTQLL
jgi:alanyl-tRNA synthetase